MGVISSIREARVAAAAALVERVAPQLASWSRLGDDIGRVGAGRSVVVQGGLSTDSYLYEPLRRLLARTGFDVDVTQLRMHGWSSVQDDARQLAAAVDAAHARSLAAGGDGTVSILAHSKGGLSSRWYLQRMGGSEYVDQLVTLGTPHNGSAPWGAQLTARAARLPGLPVLKQLGAGSELVLELNDDLPAFLSAARRTNPQFRMVSIAGDLDLPGLRGTDGLVSVGAARLPDALEGVRNIVVRDHGASHSAIAGQARLNEPALRHAVELLRR